MRTATLTLIFLVTATAAFGQCAGSNVFYYVRDAKGKFLTATANDLNAIDANVAAEGRKAPEWSVGRYRGDPLPTDMAAAVDEVNAFRVTEMCTFHAPLILKLSIKGKSMELRFVVPKAATASANFIVDSVSFQEGTYEMELTRPADASGYAPLGGFYASSLWKKVP